MKKKKWKMPHIFIILFIFIIGTAISSYFIPAGEYARVEMDGRMVVDPDSFKVIDSQPVGIMGVVKAIPQGFVEAGDIIILTLAVGAGVSVLQTIGVIPVAIDKLARKFSKNSILVIPILMLIFALFDAFIGVNEMTLVYIPIILPLMIRLGYDSITACAVALCGSAAGFSAALTNPFTIAIGQNISGLPLYSGWEFRIVTFIVTLVIGIWYIMRYASFIKKDITRSFVYEEDKNKRKKYLAEDNGEGLTFNSRQRNAGIVAILMLGITLGGVIVLKWDMIEMSGMFIMLGAVSGIVAKLSGDEICDSLLRGATDMLLGALIIGVARGVSVVMTDAKITDTIVHFFANILNNIPGSLVAIGMFVVVMIMEFLMPSGSGKAVILFPILAPLSDVVGVTRQTTVLAYQFGDGFSNIIYPTSGYFMAGITNAGVPWKKWVNFFMPLFIIWTLESAVFVFIAQMIKYGPF
ncbi:MAG: hypothetical protein WAO56_07545 [Miniphocaeibacter sp.]|uniref:YfcC family protein n=1 Tax=Miniphocaeibacter sp. TaxID=3100973 RepID=UPI0017DD9B23|nr:YfcC family protein [Gallicola sp.]